MDLGLSLGLQLSAHSSFSSSSSIACEAEKERVCSGARVSSDEEDGVDGGGRKKLRLSRDQAAVLEECFKANNTLNPKQKNALAKQLGLRARQVEVWFQNRRARTKLKQTEVDCEHLKHWCERLAEENKRLEKELAELRALKAPRRPHQPPPPGFLHGAPLATLTLCPSCRRVAPASSSSNLFAGEAAAAAVGAAPAASVLPPAHCQLFPAAAHRPVVGTPLTTRELF